MLLIKINLGSPIFFVQKRVGKNEQIFNLYKFRSMTSEKDNKGNLLPDNERLNNFGRFLRSSSLDELPSILNIIKGNLSIVGPRPLVPQYLPF
jgi:lipopolysaccharide/colanic/teichoic acid biosynthesis glycosyltransferase